MQRSVREASGSFRSSEPIAEAAEASAASARQSAASAGASRNGSRLESSAPEGRGELTARRPAHGLLTDIVGLVDCADDQAPGNAHSLTSPELLASGTARSQYPLPGPASSSLMATILETPQLESRAVAAAHSGEGRLSNGVASRLQASTHPHERTALPSLPAAIHAARRALRLSRPSPIPGEGGRHTSGALPVGASVDTLQLQMEQQREQHLQNLKVCIQRCHMAVFRHVQFLLRGYAAMLLIGS